MKRNRVAVVATVLLGFALCGAPGAWGSGPASHTDAPAPFGIAVPDRDDYRPGVKAGELPFDANALAVSKTAFVEGSGTGGGDLVEAEPNDDFDHCNDASDLPFNFCGVVNHANDEDVVAVHVTAGQAIQFNAWSQVVGGMYSPLDPILTVGYPGHVLGSNDDMDRANVNSQVNVVSPITGMLYAVVSGHHGQGGEAYDYVVSAVPVEGDAFRLTNFENEPNDVPAAADPIPLPGVKIGGLPDAGDVDYTYVDVPSGVTVVLDVSARVFGYETNARCSIVGPSGEILHTCDDMDGVDPRCNLLIAEPGRYFVKIESTQATAGDESFYMLSASIQDGAEAPVLTMLKLTGGHKLKKVVGIAFGPTALQVEVNSEIVPSSPSPTMPVNVIRVQPNVKLYTGDVITVVRPDGRRSNAQIFDAATHDGV